MRDTDWGARAHRVGGRAHHSLVAEAFARDLAGKHVILAEGRTLGLDARGTEVDEVVMLTFILHDHSPSFRHGHDLKETRNGPPIFETYTVDVW